MITLRRCEFVIVMLWCDTYGVINFADASGPDLKPS